MFRVGQKVVCINAGHLATYGTDYEWRPGEELQEDGIYTIHSTFSHPRDGTPMVRLCEVKRCSECIKVWKHDGYGAERFRPAVERKTDISIFTKMLTPNKERQFT